MYMDVEKKVDEKTIYWKNCTYGSLQLKAGTKVTIKGSVF